MIKPMLFVIASCAVFQALAGISYRRRAQRTRTNFWIKKEIEDAEFWKRFAP